MRRSSDHFSPSNVFRKILLFFPRKACQTSAKRPLLSEARRGLMSGSGADVSLSSEPHSSRAGSKRRAYKSQLPFTCCDQTTQGRLAESTATCGSQLSPLEPGTHWSAPHFPFW